MNNLKFAVIGAGAGGASMAAVLKEKGYNVRLMDKNKETINKLKARGQIKLTGKIELEAEPDLITESAAEAVCGADIIMVVTTTDGHRDVAEKIAPYLRDGQIVMLNPGHTGGALEVRAIFNQLNVSADIIVAEAADLMYACRTTETGVYFHSGLKSKTEVSALPARDTEKLMAVLKPIFPNLTAAKNVLETGLESGGALLHPIPTLMNINKLDSGISWDYYMEGVTPNIAKMVQKADDERLAVAKAFGLNPPSLVENLKTIYQLEADNLYDLIQSNKAYKGVKSPVDLSHRFVVEDTLCGTVPLSSIGRELGIQTPMLDGIIEIASIACGRDFIKEGRTVEKLGLKGKSSAEIYKMIE